MLDSGRRVLKLMDVRAHSHKVKPFIMCYLVVEHVNMLPSHQFSPYSLRLEWTRRRRKGACHAPPTPCIVRNICQRIKSLCTSKLCFNLFSYFRAGFASFPIQQHHWCHMLFSNAKRIRVTAVAPRAHSIHCANANEIIKQFRTEKIYIFLNQN